MKFKYDMSENYFQLFDEVQGLLLFNKKIRDGKKIKIKKFSTYLKLSLVIYLIFYLLLVLCMVLLNVSQNVSDIITFLMAILGGILLFIMAAYYIWFGDRRDFPIELVLDKKGIKYADDKYNWKSILEIIVTKNVVLVKLNEKRKYFFVPNDLKKDIIKEIKTYKKDIIIYELGD